MRYKLNLEFNVSDVICTTYLRMAVREILMDCYNNLNFSKCTKV